MSEMEHLQAVEAENERLRAQAETRHAQSPPLVVNGPPVICDGHDVAMVRDAPLMGWRCPQGEGWFGDEDYFRVVSALASRPGSPIATDLRVTGCGEREAEPAPPFPGWVKVPTADGYCWVPPMSGPEAPWAR